MRAAVCTSLVGEDGIEFREDWPAPGPCGANQVRIEVHAASVNFPDTLITRGLYQIRRDPPFIPGNEAAGVVTAIGDAVDTVQVGDRVLTLTGTGAFADEITATLPFQQVHRIPDAMGYADAAAFNLTYGTAGHGLIQRGHVQAGERVLITGAAGGCGSAAIQIAVALGARVIAVAGGAQKCALATHLGATDVIDHLQLGNDDRALSEKVKTLTAGRGVDIVFDNVGGESVRDLTRCLAWNGRFLVVGFAGGAVPTIALNQTILKSVSFVGVAYGASAVADSNANSELFAQLFAWYIEGKVTPHIGSRFNLADAADAVRAMHNRLALGKIVIDFGR